MANATQPMCWVCGAGAEDKPTSMDEVVRKKLPPRAAWQRVDELERSVIRKTVTRNLKPSILVRASRIYKIWMLNSLVLPVYSGLSVTSASS